MCTKKTIKQTYTIKQTCKLTKKTNKIKIIMIKAIPTNLTEK